MALEDELSNARKEIKTDSYPISIRELSSIYKAGELDIHPEFQRFLRWTPEQKAKLIESILLGIPIPSVFLFQRSDGVLDVVDGLQRISTILQFMGDLKDEFDTPLPCLALGKAQYLPSLEGKSWKSADAQHELSENIKKFFRAEKLDVKILLRDSDDSAKYELFQRINTGGTPLSDQEVRNCILIMINREAYFTSATMANNIDFKICCPLPEKLYAERYDLELILRFEILSNINLHAISEVPDLGQFLTTEMRITFTKCESSDGGGSVRLFNVSNFERVFRCLVGACGDNALRKYDLSRNRFSGPFLISAFELVALGVAANIDYVESRGPIWLGEKIKAIWSDSRADGIYGQGVSTARRLPKTLAVGRQFFAEA